MIMIHQLYYGTILLLLLIVSSISMAPDPGQGSHEEQFDPDLLFNFNSDEHIADFGMGTLNPPQNVGQQGQMGGRLSDSSGSPITSGGSSQSAPSMSPWQLPTFDQHFHNFE